MPDVRVHDAIEELDRALRRVAEVERENAILRDCLQEIIAKNVVSNIFERLFSSYVPAEHAFKTLARVDNPEACP